MHLKQHGMIWRRKLPVKSFAKPRLTEEQLMFFLQRFRKLDVTQPSHRKMLIDTFINAIFLYDDKMVLTVNFREGTETSPPLQTCKPRCKGMKRVRI